MAKKKSLIKSDDFWTKTKVEIEKVAKNAKVLFDRGEKYIQKVSKEGMKKASQKQHTPINKEVSKSKDLK